MILFKAVLGFLFGFIPKGIAWVKDVIHGNDKAKMKRIQLLVMFTIAATFAVAEAGFIWWLVDGRHRYETYARKKASPENGIRTTTADANENDTRPVERPAETNR